MNRYKYIDALRGVAILGVLMIHCKQYGSGSFLPSSFNSLVDFGARGVQLFFLVSAFTLFLSMKQRSTIEENANINFFIRRFFRIAPMYYLGILYHVLVALYFNPTHAKVNSLTILSNLTFTHGFSPYLIHSIVPGGWSIAVEMSFYLIIPLLFKSINSLRSAIVFYITTTLFTLGLKYILILYPFVDNKQKWALFLFEFLPNQLPIFGLGFIFYFIVTDHVKAVKENYKLILALLLSTSFIYVLLKLTLKEYIFETHFVIGPVFLLLAYILSQKNYGIIVNSFMTYIGKISYSMYLVHFVVLYWLTKLNVVDYITVTNTPTAIVNYLIRYIVVLLISIVISDFFYKSVEVPFQNVGKFIIRKLKSKDFIKA